MQATAQRMDVGARAARVRAGFADAGVDALVVTRLPNVRYLTGFTGSAGIVALTPDALLLVTDGRYAEQSRAQLEAAGVDGQVVIGATASEQHAALVAAVAGCPRLGLEADGVTWAQQRTFAGEFADHELVPTDRRRRGGPADQGARRGGPDPGGLRDGRRRARRAAAHARRRPHRARLRARRWSSGCGAGGPPR